MVFDEWVIVPSHNHAILVVQPKTEWVRILGDRTKRLLFPGVLSQTVVSRQAQRVLARSHGMVKRRPPTAQITAATQLIRGNTVP